MLANPPRRPSAPTLLQRALGSPLPPLLIICVVGVFLRTYRITTIPTGALFDEGYNALDALRMIDGWRPIFLPANSGREVLFIYLQALSIAQFGPIDWPLRVPSVIVGILTIPLSYLLIARMYSRRVALLAAAWLTVSFWHVTFSRIGLRSIILPIFVATAFYCLWRGFDAAHDDKKLIGHTSDSEGTVIPSRGEESWSGVGSTPTGIPRRPRIGMTMMVWFGLSGLALGVAQYTYTSARFLPLVVLAFAVYLFLVHRQLFWQTLPGFVLSGLVAAVIFLPEGIYFLRHPTDFDFRSGAVSIFNPGLNHGDFLGTLLYSTTRTLGMFTFQGDGTWERNIPDRPIFDPASSLFLGLGLVRVLAGPRDPKRAFTLIWLVVMLVPSVIAVLDAPNFLRVTSLIPALFALPALGADWLWSLWDRLTKVNLRPIPLLLVGTGFLVGTIQTYYSYFDVWANDRFVVQTFSADHWQAISQARALAATTTTPIYVGAGDVDEPSMAYNLRGPGGTRGIRVFNDHISIILPPPGSAAWYIFPERDLPSTPVLNRLFPGQIARLLARTVDGEPVSVYQFPADQTELRPEHAVAARFGDRVQVNGFDFSRDANAGQTLTVRWYWTILTPETRQLTFFNQVIGDGDQKRGAVDIRAFVPGYWPTGTSGVSTFDVPIDPATTTGPYSLVTGIYYLDNLKRLPVFDTLGRPAGSQITLGPIKVHGQPPPTPRVENPRPAVWADGINLLGDSIAPAQPAPGQKVTLTLFWSARSRPTSDYTVFVHLLDGAGRVIGQADAPPQNGRYPTSLWDAGDVVADPHEISLDPTLPPGRYSFEIGLYLPDDGRRLALLNSDGQPGDDHLPLTGITLAPRA